MGKSSLMARAAKRLRALGVNVVVLDLQALGTNITLEQWIFDWPTTSPGHSAWRMKSTHFGSSKTASAPSNASGPLSTMSSSPASAPDLPNRPGRPRPRRLTRRSEQNLVIFVDEIDIVRSLPFPTDDFFAAIE